MRGVSLALCGPDGVGKSTVADAVADHLPGSTLQMHHRPGVLRSPQDLERDFTEPYAKTPRSRVMSILKTLYLFADWWLGWLFVIWPRVRRGDSVVIQRPWLDLIVDPKRYRLSVPPSMLRRLGRLLPDPSLTVLLQAPAEVIQARKTELSMSELEDQADRWRKEASLARRAKVVDASGDIDDVTSSILAGVTETSSRGGRHFSARAGNLILPRYPSKAVSEGLRLYHPMDRGFDEFFGFGSGTKYVERTWPGVHFFDDLRQFDPSEPPIDQGRPPGQTGHGGSLIRGREPATLEKYLTDQVGMTGEATEWMLDQGIKVMGIDAITFDPPIWAMFERKKFWEAHRVMARREYYHLENMTNLHLLPPHGFKLSLFPIKWVNTTAAPVRAVVCGIVDSVSSGGKVKKYD